jgi:hypothetical protein
VKIFGAQLHVLHGASRWVFVYRRWALKLPYTARGQRWWHVLLTGLLDNMGERDIWRWWPAARPKLAPVLHAGPGGLWVLMRRVQPLTDEEWATIATPELHDAWRTVAEGDDRGYTIPVEHKRGGHGTLDGRIVACDYGVPDDVYRRMKERGRA